MEKALGIRMSNMSDMELNKLSQTLSMYNQEHLLSFWPRLTPDQRSHLLNDINSIDFQAIQVAFEKSQLCYNNCQKLDSVLQPIPKELHQGISSCTMEELNSYKQKGLEEISDGHVAALLLAGGQGTRLGVPFPKGMYDVGLPSRKTLYQLQCEKLLRLEELAHKETGKRGKIPWYIMTSEHTMDATVDFFAEHDYFGMDKNNLVVFEQFMLPCLTFDGKIIMDETWKIAKSPDGNGGLFRALQKRGILADMISRGVRYVHVYCVDNILVKMADPVFTGYCISKDVECAAKVVEKVSPTETVGVVCRVDGKYRVVEYSEISLESAEKRDSEGKLYFNAGNICNHFFTTDFLQEIGTGQNILKYHIAKKKIPHVDADGKLIRPTECNGIKLEKFVFDVFSLTNKFAAWEVLRQHEFSPLKNSDDLAKKDTPTTARQSLYGLHRYYIETAGGRFPDENQNMHNGDTNKKITKYVGICEISPLLTYDGEGLDEIVAGETFSFPLVMAYPDEKCRADSG